MTASTRWEPTRLGARAGELHAFVRGGRDDLDAVVLLHGAGANALTWTPIAEAFGDRRVVLVDMPGHGLSAADGDWNLDATAARVADAIRRLLPGERPLWGGHSWGGKVAGLVVADDATAAGGLLLVDPSPSSALPIDVEDFVDSTWGDEMKPHATPADAARVACTLRHWQPWNDDSAAAFRHGLARRADGTWSLGPTRDQLVALATATLHVDATERLAAADAAVPTLLLIAASSQAWQEVTNAAVFSRATQVVVAGDHWLHLGSRDAVIASIRAWLALRSD